MEEKDTYSKEQEQIAYEKALEDFSKRLIVVDIPSNSTAYSFNKHKKRILGIDCVLSLIHHETNTITPLKDEFEAPYDPITMWAIAVKNSIHMTHINEEVSKPEENVYVISSHSGRAIVCCDAFWNELCDKLNTLRLFVNMYYKQNQTFLMVSPLKNETKMDIRTYLHKANQEDSTRISYVFVRDVGMLSEAALNSEI